MALYLQRRLAMHDKNRPPHLPTLLLFAIFQIAHTLDNGAALTPPLGWQSWNAYHMNFNSTLFIEMAEAMAEWVHARIRSELGFADPDGMPLRDVLAQRYRGSRYSFGYPACPNVADSRQQLEWLGAERIGLTMDESDQLEPEQSTTALVALHSQARYFSA